MISFIQIGITFIIFFSHFLYPKSPLPNSPKPPREEVLSVSTSSATPNSAPELPKIAPKTENQNLPVLIDCVGPDGKHLGEKITQKVCDDFNQAWRKSSDSNDHHDSQPQNNNTSDNNQGSSQPSSSDSGSPAPQEQPLNASIEITWSGNTVNAKVSANKTLKNCLFEIWGTGLNMAGSGTIDGNTCTVRGSASNWTENSKKVWVRIEAQSGETKDFGETPPSQKDRHI